jgi:hypothetical protein
MLVVLLLAKAMPIKTAVAAAYTDQLFVFLKQLLSPRLLLNLCIIWGSNRCVEYGEAFTRY